MTYPRTLKALTIRQPYASLIQARVKVNETRGWITHLRGPIAIHSGLAPVTLDDLRQPGIEDALRRHCIVPDDCPLERFHEFLPLGEVLCIADLKVCHRTDIMVEAGEIQMTEEFYLGNYGPGRFAFELEVMDVFEPGIPAKGAQGFWTFTFPDHPPKKEPIVAKKDNNKKKLEGSAFPGDFDNKAVGEKNDIDKAFANSKTGGPAAASDSKTDEAESAKPAETATVLPDVPTYAEAIAPDEFLPAFQKIVFIKFSREDLAIRAEKMAACDEEMKKMQVALADYVKERKSEIAGVEAQRSAYSSQVTAKGEEREIECRKRINEERQEVTIFNAANMEIVETRKLDRRELQTELQIIATHRAAASTHGKPPKGSKLVQGNFPADKKVGAGEPDSDANDAKNEAAIQALAGNKE